jgi:hypothetical protein
MSDRADMLDVARWAKNNPDLLKKNPELAGMLHAGEMPAKVSKFRNIRTKDPDGETYDSGREAADAVKFAQAVLAGEYLLYKHHLVVPLPGGIKIELDHFLINKKLQPEVFDTKSSDGKATKTRDWINKKKLFESTYGIPIQII